MRPVERPYSGNRSALILALQRLLIPCALAVAIFCLPGWALAETTLSVPVFPLTELKPGLVGVGKTVIRGTEVQDFAVEILELIPEGGFDGGPMVLARFTGDVVDHSKGIAGGYSGSPVYINGKLLGAVSMAIPFTDTHVGGITPIGSMMRALPDNTEPEFEGNTVLPSSEDSGTPVDENGEPLISYTYDANEALAYNEKMRAAGEERYAAVLSRTPIYFSSVAPTVLDNFSPKFSELLGENFELIERPMGKATDYGLFLRGEGEQPGLLMDKSQPMPPLTGGDAIAVSLIQGDIEAYAIGTLTYADNQGRFLAFGHPMMGLGDTNFPVGKAYITWTHESIMRAFKEGVRLNTVGTLTKDHAAAVGGSFSVEPDLIPVRVKISDVDLNKSKEVRFKVVRDKNFTPILVGMGMSQAAMELLDRQPGGTMKMSYHIEGVGLKEPLRRTNYYTDDFDVVMSAAYDLLPMANLLETNIYRNVKIDKIEIQVEITGNRVNASIDDAAIIVDKAEATTEVPVEPAAGAEQIEQLQQQVQEVPTSFDGADNPERQSRVFYRGLPLQQERRVQEAPQQPAPGTEEQTATPATAMPFGMQQAPPTDMPTFKPGDTIRVKVRLQPYRTDAQWRAFEIKVPEDFPAGTTSLVVHGGGDLISYSELGGKGSSLFGMGPIIDVQERDLDTILDQILSWPRNNELVLTLQRPFDPTQATQLGEEEKKKPEDHVDSVYQMEWVIYNGFSIPVNIQPATPPTLPGQENAEGVLPVEQPQQTGDVQYDKNGNRLPVPGYYK